MAEYSVLRPIGTCFTEIVEKPTYRQVTYLRVKGHQTGADGQVYELVEELSTDIIPKRIPAPSERK